MGAEQTAHQQQLLEWAINRGAFVHPALELKVDGDAGRGWMVNEDVPCGTTLISVPLSLCVPAPGCACSSSGAAWHSSLRAGSARRVCDHLAGVRPPLHQACTHAVLLAYLLAHHKRGAPSRAHTSKAGSNSAGSGTVPNLFGLPLPPWLFDAEDSEQDASTAGECEHLPGCGYAPYLACLPRSHELNMLPTWPPEALDELSCTSLAPQVERRKAALQAPDCGGEEMAAFLTSAMPANDPKDNTEGRAMTSAVARSFLNHATLLCKSRAFVISADSHDADESEQWRLLVPLIDMVNHSAEPRRICTRVRIAERELSAERALDQLELKDSPQTPMEPESDVTATAVVLVTTRNTAAGTSLCLCYGDFSSADCLQRFGFVDELADALHLPPVEAASVPQDAVLAACRMAHPGGTRLQLDTLAEQRLGRQAVARDCSFRNGRRSPRSACCDNSVDVIRIGHPDDDRGLEPLLAAIRVHSGESLEQSIADRCYNAEAIRAVARDVIGWTIACHWPCTLVEELRRLHDAEVEMELDESLGLAGIDELSAAGTAEPARNLRRQRSSTVDVDSVEVELTDYIPGGAGRSFPPSWFSVQVARLRVRELAVLSRWHEALSMERSSSQNSAAP